MSTPSFAAAITALAQAVSATGSEAVLSVSMLTQLAQPNTTPTPSKAARVAQACTSDLIRRQCVIEAARAAAHYQPTHYDDAVAMLERICTLLDGEIQVAGDQGEDSVYLGLRTLRTAVVQDLSTRGTQLANMMSVKMAEPIPAPVLAQRLYRDARRADDLVAQNNPPHPAFMSKVSWAATK